MRPYSFDLHFPNDERCWVSYSYFVHLLDISLSYLEDIYPNPLPMFKYLYCYWIFCIFWVLILCQICNLHFFPILWITFLLYWYFLWCLSFLFFFFISIKCTVCVFLCLLVPLLSYPRNLHQMQCVGASVLCFLVRVIILCLIFRALINF